MSFAEVISENNTFINQETADEGLEKDKLFTIEGQGEGKVVFIKRTLCKLS